MKIPIPGKQIALPFRIRFVSNSLIPGKLSGSEISFSNELVLKLKSKDVIFEDWFRLFLKMPVGFKTKMPEANTLPA